MAVISAKKATTPHKTKVEYDAFPHSKLTKQQNFRVPENLIESLEALAGDAETNKQELVNLAIFNMLCSYGYENKKLEKKKKVVI